MKSPKLFQMKTSHVRMEPSLCFVFVSCVHRRVGKGSGEGTVGCVVHVDVHGECVMLWVDVM